MFEMPAKMWRAINLRYTFAFVANDQYLDHPLEILEYVLIQQVLISEETAFLQRYIFLIINVNKLYIEDFNMWTNTINLTEPER